MTKYGKVEFERRAYPRFRMELPMIYEVQPEGPAKSGRTLNASQGGLAVNLPEPVAPGTRMSVRLHLSDPKAPQLLEIVGRVIWSEEISQQPAQYRIGLAFEDVTPDTLALLKRFERIWLEPTP
jgi:c-di-GMP-binding flagellar brake protein YcgR